MFADVLKKHLADRGLHNVDHIATHIGMKTNTVRKILADSDTVTIGQLEEFLARANIVTRVGVTPHRTEANVSQLVDDHRSGISVSRLSSQYCMSMGRARRLITRNQ